MRMRIVSMKRTYRNWKRRECLMEWNGELSRWECPSDRNWKALEGWSLFRDNNLERKKEDFNFNVYPSELCCRLYEFLLFYQLVSEILNLSCAVCQLLAAWSLIIYCILFLIAFSIFIIYPYVIIFPSHEFFFYKTLYLFFCIFFFKK